MPLSLSQYKALLNNMTIKKIIESTIVASSKLLHKCSTKGKCFNFSNTLIATPFLPTKKAELTEVLSFGSSAIFTPQTRRFPSPPHGGFSFVGQKTLYIILISLIALLYNLIIFMRLIKKPYNYQSCT